MQTGLRWPVDLKTHCLSLLIVLLEHIHATGLFLCIMLLTQVVLIFSPGQCSEKITKVYRFQI
jgi:hypothetical protein